MESIGRRYWAIAEGYIPSQSSFADRALMSHETACILNAGDKAAGAKVSSRVLMTRANARGELLRRSAKGSAGDAGPQTGREASPF